MSWICPYCGRINTNDPLNSRDDPKCQNCGKEYETPENALARRDRDIDEHKEYIHTLVSEISYLVSEIDDLECEIAPLKRDCEDKRKELKEEKTELKKLEETKIFGIDCEEFDPIELRTAKARLDKYQQKLPVEVSA